MAREFRRTLSLSPLLRSLSLSRVSFLLEAIQLEIASKIKYTAWLQQTGSSRRGREGAGRRRAGRCFVCLVLCFSLFSPPLGALCRRPPVRIRIPCVCADRLLLLHALMMDRRAERRRQFPFDGQRDSPWSLSCVLSGPSLSRAHTHTYAYLHTHTTRIKYTRAQHAHTRTHKHTQTHTPFLHPPSAALPLLHHSWHAAFSPLVYALPPSHPPPPTHASQ